MSTEPTKESSEHAWVPVPPVAEGEAGEQPTADAAAVPVTPPPPGVDATPDASSADQPAPMEPQPAPVEPEPAPVQPEPAPAEPKPAAAAAAELTSPQPAAPAGAPLSPEPAAAASLSWEPPLANSDAAPRKSGSDRPELVLAAGFAGGFVIAQILRRLAR